jgi:hypothetical protein
MTPMTRNPFVWEIQVRREVLDDEMARLRELPYTVWRQVIVAPITKQVTARDNKPYQLRVTAEYLRGSQDIHVTMTLARATLLRRNLMRQSFVVTPDNQFRV